MLVQACDRFFATPLWASIQEGLAQVAVGDDAKQPKTTHIVQMAQQVAYAMGRRAYLVLDAYFAVVYKRRELVRHLALNLLWRPTKGMLRFILVESSHGRMVLISSDPKLNPIAAVELYCRRATIETTFDTLKNVLGGMGYHFWSQYLSPASRRPQENARRQMRSSDPVQTRNTLAAIEKFVNVQLLVAGMLQLIAKAHPDQVKSEARCWLRTISAYTPSEFVTRTALANVIKNNLYGFAKDWITRLIRRKQKHPKKKGLHRMPA